MSGSLYPISHPGLEEVRVTDAFWLPKIDRNREITIPYAFGKCEETGRIDNFAKAAGLMEGEHEGERYNDSDVYKILEGACYTLITNPDPEMRRYVDNLVTLIAAAQEDDGYLYTTRTVSPDKPAPGAGRDKWIDVWVSHELYSVGHMYEAAVAHYRATGERTLLEVAVKNADLIMKEFGWGKREAAPGHQEIEIGLVKLWEVTGNRDYLDLAQFFLDVRGKPQDHLKHEPGSRFEVYNDLEYLQQHLPVLEQKEAVGHAVRGAYMYAGMADVAQATGSENYLVASEHLWRDVVAGKIYLTGGIGSKSAGEAFGKPFELPNMTAYTETCASVANVFWNDRLFMAYGRSDYYDVLERTLYNGLISGIAADGTNFFYPNPLESDGSFLRAGWFDCSCCPGNIARFMPSMHKYIYALDNESVYVNLFIASELNSKRRGKSITLIQEGNYPWSGDITLRIVEPAGGDYDIKIRIPSWTGDSPMPGGLYSYIDPLEGSVDISVNGVKVDYTMESGYAVIDRKWEKGDMVTLSLPMNVRRVKARDEVESDRGKVAFERGPLLYCFEEADNGKVLNLTIPKKVETGFIIDKELLDGTGTIHVGTGTDNQPLTGIPYFAWNNRGRGEMITWIRER